MKMLKREFYLFFAATALVVLCAFAWGRPFLANGTHASAPDVRTEIAQSSTVLAGSVLRNGDQLVFRTATGEVFRLDQPQQAQAFAGRSVMITGSLDAHTGTLHIVAIRPAA